MKNILIAAITLFLLSACTEQKLEQKDSNGGSGVESEFVEAAKSLIQRLKQKPIEGVDVTAFEAVVAQSKIVIKKDLDLRGRSVDAINYPALKLIEVSVSRWNSLANTPWVKLQLVFHEYLGLLGIDDTNYRVSRNILSSDACNRSAAVVAAIETELRRSCDEVTLKDLSLVTRLAISKLEKLVLSDFKDLQNLGKLEINSEIPSLELTPEFLKLLPKLFNLDVVAREIIVKPLTFANSRNDFKYLRLENPRLEEYGIKGLKAQIVLFEGVAGGHITSELEKALNHESYACGRVADDVPETFTLACQKF